MDFNFRSYEPKFPHGLMFHRFHVQGSHPVGQGSLTADEFEAILHFVGIQNILSPDEWLYKLRNANLGNNDLCITFDDGLRCQYDVCLPVLEKYDLKAFWFIYSSVFEGKYAKFEIYNYFGTSYFDSINDFFHLFFSKCEKSALYQLDRDKFKTYAREMQESFPFYSMNDLKFRFLRDRLLPKERFENIIDKIMEERGVDIDEIAKKSWLSNSELKILNEKGHCIGLHSYDHPLNLSSLPYRKQLEQYMKNHEHIKGICNKEIVSMSHPLNSYNNDTLKVLTKLGILCGFRSNMIPPRGERINPNYLEIAREDPVNIFKRSEA